MKHDLVPICVKLFKKNDGAADWPKFNQIDASIRKGQKWSHYIDNLGIGWYYDKVDNLGTGHIHGTAMTMVPEDFAEAAVALFPDKVTICSEEEIEAFWETRVTVNDPVEDVDLEALQAIQVRAQLESLGVAPAPTEEQKAERTAAIDPNDDKRGIRKNKRKTWKDAKKELRFSVHKKHEKKPKP
jgi:hypothetical protein